MAPVSHAKIEKLDCEQRYLFELEHPLELMHCPLTWLIFKILGMMLEI